MTAREERANLRKKIALTNRFSVSLSLNVPGFPKSNATVRKFFCICLDDLRIKLKANLIPVCDFDAVEQTDSAGDFFIVPISSSHLSESDVKLVSEDFEEEHALGRFIDVDVTDHMGDPVSSGKKKLCFYCAQRPADECRLERTHDLQELRTFMFSRMEDHNRLRRERDICQKLASLALNAILTEISLTPKPGLVDKFSNGSHVDMNYQTFLSSTAAISPMFIDLVMEGFYFKDHDLAKALPVIRSIGTQMEAAMYAATNKVNTQKGLVFFMGLTLFASGYHYAHQDVFETDRFREIIGKICKDMVSRELETNNSAQRTHGEEVFNKYSIAGARGEAEKRFPTVFDFGLPVLMNYPELNEETLQRAFLSIAAHNNDTNILFRSNMRVLEDFKTLALNAFNHFSKGNLDKLIGYCRKENISPGGSADLLVVSIFVHALIQSGNNIGQPFKERMNHEF